MMVGGFFDRYGDSWDEVQIDWFERFIEEQDVDIMAWAMQVQPVPPAWQGAMMDALMRLDFVAVAK